MQSTCPKCQSRKTVKNGSTNGISKRKCKDCGYQYSRDTLPGKPDAMKRLALHMYLEGLGLRAIGRILGVSNVAVLKWVKKAATEVKRLHKEQSGAKSVTTMEPDEMWHFVSKKNKNAGSGLLMIESEENPLITKSVIAITTPQGSSGAD